MRYFIYKNISAHISLALDCLRWDAISKDEFLRWIRLVIEESEDELPDYFFNLLDIHNGVHPSEYYDALGSVPGSDLNDRECNAILGIAHKCGAYDEPGYKISFGEKVLKDVLKDLLDNPHIETRFREMFSFINY